MKLEIGINQTLGNSLFTEKRDICLLLLNGTPEELKEIQKRINLHDELIEKLKECAEIFGQQYDDSMEISDLNLATSINSLIQKATNKTQGEAQNQENKS